MSSVSVEHATSPAGEGVTAGAGGEGGDVERGLIDTEMIEGQDRVTGTSIFTTAAAKEGVVMMDDGTEGKEGEAVQDGVPFDLAADRKRRKEESLLCYGLSAGIAILLTVMIIVWPITRYTSPESIRYQGTARRIVYIAAEPVAWDFTQGGQNLCFDPVLGGLGPNNTDPEADRSTLDGTWKKTRFRAYSDVFFNNPLPVDPKWEHLGILGPAILAEAGDTVDIFLQNKCSFPLNIEPSGSVWDFSHLLPPVVSGRTIHFTWVIPLDAAPSRKIHNLVGCTCTAPPSTLPVMRTVASLDL